MFTPFSCAILQCSSCSRLFFSIPWLLSSRQILSFLKLEVRRFQGYRCLMKPPTAVVISCSFFIKFIKHVHGQPKQSKSPRSNNCCLNTCPSAPNTFWEGVNKAQVKQLHPKKVSVSVFGAVGMWKSETENMWKAMSNRFAPPRTAVEGLCQVLHWHLQNPWSRNDAAACGSLITSQVIFFLEWIYGLSIYVSRYIWNVEMIVFTYLYPLLQ